MPGRAAASSPKTARVLYHADMAFCCVRAAIRVPVGFVLPALLAGCFPSEKPSPSAPEPVTATPATLAEADPQVLALQAEVARLTAENRQLRMTPSAMAAEVRSAVVAQ